MNKLFRLPLFVMLLSLFSSCDLIGGIFKAGMWTGVIVIVGIIALIFWLIRRGGRSA